jgi:hypothetical protein
MATGTVAGKGMLAEISSSCRKLCLSNNQINVIYVMSNQGRRERKETGTDVTGGTEND